MTFTTETICPWQRHRSTRAEAGFPLVRAVDETARRRGHHYIRLFADLNRSRLSYAAPGRDASAVSLFRENIEPYGGRAGRIRDLGMDMSAAYMKGAGEALPAVGVTFDRFHDQRLMNPAVDGREAGRAQGAPRAEPHALPLAQETRQAHRLPTRAARPRGSWLTRTVFDLSHNLARAVQRRHERFSTP